MKFEIANIGETIEQVNIVRLGLSQGCDGVVNLVASNTLGETSYLLEILLDGTFARIEGVNQNLGFPLTEDDEIIVE